MVSVSQRWMALRFEVSSPFVYTTTFVLSEIRICTLRSLYDTDDSYLSVNDDVPDAGSDRDASSTLRQTNSEVGQNSNHTVLHIHACLHSLLWPIIGFLLQETKPTKVKTSLQPEATGDTPNDVTSTFLQQQKQQEETLKKQQQMMIEQQQKQQVKYLMSSNCFVL